MVKRLRYTPVKSTLENLKPIKNALHGVDVLIHGAAILHAPSYSDFLQPMLKQQKT